MRSFKTFSLLTLLFCFVGCQLSDPLSIFKLQSNSIDHSDHIKLPATFKVESNKTFILPTHQPKQTPGPLVMPPPNLLSGVKHADAH